MASFRRPYPFRSQAKAQSISDDPRAYDRQDAIDFDIGQLADENRRLQILAEGLRADIVRLMSLRETRH